MTVYENLGLKRVINASGRMTALGVSTASNDVANAVFEASRSYVDIEQLMDKADELISSYNGAEATLVTSCASSSIALAVAGCIAKDNKRYIEQLPDSKGLANEVIIQKGHVVQFGAPITSLIRMAGGITVEIGTATHTDQEDLANFISEKTACIIYVKSHHAVQKGMLSLETIIDIANKYNIPVVVDAAAEEDMCSYVQKGVAMVCYSGAKALEAPTSGILTGKRLYIDYARKQLHGIGRPMKIGKENIVGLMQAVKEYFNKDEDKIAQMHKDSIQYLKAHLDSLAGITCKVTYDEVRNNLMRLDLILDSRYDANIIYQRLIDGNPSIHTRPVKLYQNTLVIDPRPLVDGDKEIIVDRIKTIMEEY